LAESPGKFVIPINRLFRKELWPRDFFGPPRFFSPAGPGPEENMDHWLEDLFDRVFFSDYRAIDGLEGRGFGFHINLWIKGPLAFSVNSFYGFDFVVGARSEDEWLEIPTTVSVLPDFEIVFHRILLGIRLPRDIFRLPFYRADTSAEEPFRVEVPIVGKLRIDSALDLHFEPEAPVSFGPIELFESGFMLTVQNAVLDLSREQKIQEIVEAGLPDDFRGFFARKLIVQPPPYLDLNPKYAVELGETPRELEFIIEKVGIGTGGLHGTIGIREKISESIPVAERPTVTTIHNTVLLHEEPKTDSPTSGYLSPGEFFYIVGKTADELWFLIDTTKSASEKGLGIGYGWVEATKVEKWGDLAMVPIVPSRSTDLFDPERPLVFGLGVPVRLEQFYITFRDSVPVDVGIRASTRVQMSSDEMIQITLFVDSQLNFLARLSEVLSPSPLPDVDRSDTFNLVPKGGNTPGIIVVRVDGIELAAKRISYSDDPNSTDVWTLYMLSDLTIFFKWSFRRQTTENADFAGVSLTGIGIKYTTGELPEPAWSNAAKLKLASEAGNGDVSSGSGTKDVFSRGLKVPGTNLAISIDSIGVGAESSGAYYVSIAGGVSHFTGFKAKGMLGVRFRWKEGEYLGVKFEKALFKVDSETLEGELNVEYIDESVPVTGGFERREGWRGRGRFSMKIPPRIFVNLEAAFGDEPVTHVYFFLDVGSNACGIPIGAISFYGISGLFGYNFVPNKADNARWYEDWFRDLPPQFSAVATEKWRVKEDSWTVGFGTTIGTSGDKGHKFSAKLIFAYSNPGPIAFLAGHGNIVTAIEALQHPEQSLLSLLIIYDGRGNTFEATAQVKYQKPRAGTPEARAPDGTDLAGYQVDCYGLLDLFFNLSKTSNWHVYLGERPKDKRIRSELLRFLRVDAYLMIDPSMSEFGASVGWDLRKKWGPLRVELAAWIEGVLGYIYEPNQVFGILRVGGHAHLSAFGFGAGISVGADLAGGGKSPWFYHVELTFRLETPWYLPDITVRKEFGDRKDYLPPTPLALRSMAITNDQPVSDIETKLYPDLDPDGDRLYIDPVDLNYDEAEAVMRSPLVPLDGKPAIGFGHPFNELTGLVDNPAPVVYKEAFGEEGFFRYDLVQIQLWRRPRGSTGPWSLVDERVSGESRDPIDWSDYDGDLHIFGHTKLHGKLLFDASSGEMLPVGLQLWAKTPFNIHMNTDQQAEDALDYNPDYPCVQLPDEPAMVCNDYSDFAPGQFLPESHLLGRVSVHSPRGGLVVSYNMGYYYNMDETHRTSGRLRFCLPERAARIRLRLSRRLTPIFTWSAGREGEVIFQQLSESGRIDYANDRGIDWLEVHADSSGYVVEEVCFDSWRAHQELAVAVGAAQQVHLAYPDGVDIKAETLLEPDKEYKISTTTEVLFSEDGLDWQTRETFVQNSYFKTAGPPGLFPTDSDLRDLVPYVHHTVPTDKAEPVYRGYDVKIAFRDDAAVRGMYVRSLETLSLFISDGTSGTSEALNSYPLLIPPTWLRDNRIQSNYQLGIWLNMLENAHCINSGGNSGSDVVSFTPAEILNPERKYDASIVLASSPYFRRDRFEISDLSEMTQFDTGTVDAPGRWAIEEGMLMQQSRISGTPTSDILARPGSALIFGESNWRNYKIRTTFTSTAGQIGVIAGYKNENNYYLAIVDIDASLIEIVCVANGVWKRLGLRNVTSPQVGEEHILNLQYTGEWLQMALDEEQFEPVYDSTFARGKAGFFTSGAEGAKFRNASLEGISLYSFSFTTSRYEHFMEHIGSFVGSSARLFTAVEMSAILGPLTLAISRFPINNDISDQADLVRGEIYEQILEIIGLPNSEPLDRVEVTLIITNDGPIAWLIESQEPLRWRDRTSLAISRQHLDEDAFWPDPDTLRLHHDALMMDPDLIRRAATKVETSSGLANLRVAPILREFDKLESATLDLGSLAHRATARNSHGPLLEEPLTKNLANLKLLKVEYDDEIERWYIELMATVTRDLTGVRLQLRGNIHSGDVSYIDFFTFPIGTTVNVNDIIRIYEGEPTIVDPNKEYKLLVFYSGTSGLAQTTKRSSVIRLISKKGIVEEVFPILPSNNWVDVDPALVRLIFTADTRKALVFVTNATGMPDILQSGHYRFTLTFRRDLGFPESTWSYHGNTAPETATICVTVPEVTN
jgi:hypothetical protein